MPMLLIQGVHTLETWLRKVINFIINPTFLLYKMRTQFFHFGLLCRLNEMICEECPSVANDPYVVP